MCDSGDPKVWVWKLSPDLMCGEYEYLVFRAESPCPNEDNEHHALVEALRHTLDFMNDDRDDSGFEHEIKIELVQIRESEMQKMDEAG